MSDKKNEAVVFDFPTPDGGTVERSNDPLWNAQKLVGQATPETSNDAEELERLRAENEQLRAAVEAEGSDDDDEEDDGTDEFTGLTGKQLKAKATELGVDISGLSKVGEVRQALRDHVAAQG